MNNDLKNKILIDGEFSANGNFPLMDDSQIGGGYKIVNSISERDSIPEEKRKIGMLVCVQYENGESEFFKLNNDNTFAPFILGSGAGNMSLYASKNSVPKEFPDEANDEYLVVSDTSPKFTEEEKYSMMLQTMNVLFNEVSKIKKTMFSHMDCGNIAENNSLSRTLSVLNDVEAKEPIEFGDTGESIVQDDWKEIEEAEPEPDDYFKISHLSIKSGLESEYEKYGHTLLPMELFWMTDKKRLYIKQFDGTMFWINKQSNNDDTPINPILPDMENLKNISFIAPDETKYNITITNDGNFKIVNATESIKPDESQLVTSGTFKDLSKTLFQPKLYINSIYCGGMDNENPSKYQGCSHNFVELSNLTEQDIYLNNLSLQYSINGTIWEVLPLEGVIKAGGTFLIRGAECSIKDVNTTRIKVDSYDMLWHDKNDSLIKFSTTKCKFLLCYGTRTMDDASPYKQDTGATDKAYVKLGYIDMVGMNKPGASTAEAIDGFEKSAFAQLVPNNRFYLKYFAMDPVKQATKTIGKRNNANDFTWIELDKNLQPNIENYTPKASYENKNIFYNKTKLSNESPNLINVTFGIDAHKTRCFNWISKDYHDEFIWIRKSGETEFKKYESFKDSDNRVKYKSKFYNRIRVVATSKEAYTSHKFIITDLVAGTYEFKVGRENYESEIQRFKVSAKSSNIFSFVQHSDQQGFNWIEYEPWRKTAEYIRKHENPLFTVNTGDHTQNGNRISEWLDYYNAGKQLFTGEEIKGLEEFKGVEQMNCIGNNDLCPENFELLGNGSDMSKLNSINFQFFYTYEMDEENMPIITSNNIDYYVPSLYSFNYNDVHFIVVNSEIPATAQNILFDNNDVYEFMRNWCEKDLEKHKSYKSKIAICHEMPFTIITNAVIKNYLDDNTVSRGGSRLNTETTNENTYWFSRMLEKHGVRLCLGGHKHTYSVSYPIKENVDKLNVKHTMQPIIQTLDEDFASKLTEQDKKLCKIEVVDKITAPVYAMCQASGYKLTSNKELPATSIPWLQSYFPCVSDGKSDKPNTGQQYPFYIRWEISSTKIVGKVIKLDNIMTNGKFNINTQNPNEIKPLNGNGSSNSNIEIIL